MEVTRFLAIFLLIFTVTELLDAKNSFYIQQDNMQFTYDAQYGVARLFIANNNTNLLMNVTKQLPTNANIVLKLWHRNPRGKFEMFGIPWTGNACQYIKTDRIVYDSLRLRKGTELPEKCPIQPGQYYVKDYDVNQIVIPFAVPLGQYKLEIRGVSGKAEMFKVIWNGQLIRA